MYFHFNSLYSKGFHYTTTPLRLLPLRVVPLHALRVLDGRAQLIRCLMFSGPETGKRKQVTRKADGKLTGKLTES